VKTLSMDTIIKLVRQDEAATMPSAYKERWPGEVNLLKLANAVERSADFVLFTNGTRFRITYYETNVRVNPSTGFVPMGWFSKKQLKEAKATIPELES